MTILAKLKEFDYYRRAALSILPVSFALLMYLILGQDNDFLLPEWFLDLIIVPAFTGNLLSGSTYLGRAVDLAPQKTNLKEKIGTYTGIVLGIIVGIASAILHESIPLLSSLSDFANVIFTLSQVSVFAGFGNRIGSSLDKNRLANEQKAIGAASVMGIVSGLILFLTSSVALVSIVGITSFATAGAALPFWLGGILFVTTFSSNLTSFADYSSKAFNFVKSKLSNDKKTQQRVKERFHEYRGSFCGASTGFIVGALIVGALFVTQPHIFVGICGVITATIAITTSISVLGGLFSRIGRVMDGFTQKKIVEKETFPQPKPQSTSSPTYLRKMLNDRRPSMPTPITESRPVPGRKKTARPSEAGLYRPSSVDSIIDKQQGSGHYKRIRFGSV